MTCYVVRQTYDAINVLFYKTTCYVCQFSLRVSVTSKVGSRRHSVGREKISELKKVFYTLQIFFIFKF